MIETRAMVAGDRAYVASTWARSSRYGLRTHEAFRFVNGMLDGVNVGVNVVVLASGATVHAWACASDDALHYAYVPGGSEEMSLRGHGLARRAITALFGAYPSRIATTHRWPFGSARFRYAPHLLLRTAA